MKRVVNECSQRWCFWGESISCLDSICLRAAQVWWMRFCCDLVMAVSRVLAEAKTFPIPPPVCLDLVKKKKIPLHFPVPPSRSLFLFPSLFPYLHLSVSLCLQLQLVSFPFLSFPFLSFPFLSFPFLSFRFLSFPFLSFTLLYFTLLSLFPLPVPFPFSCSIPLLLLPFHFPVLFLVHFLFPLSLRFLSTSTFFSFFIFPSFLLLSL